MNTQKAQEEPTFPQFPYRGHIGPKPATPVMVLGLQKRRVRQFTVSRWSSRRPGHMKTYHLLVAFPDGRQEIVPAGTVQVTKEAHYQHWSEAWQEWSGPRWSEIARKAPGWSRAGWPAAIPGALPA